MKSEMEAQPIELSLSGVMTFLFAPFYFQYNLQDYGGPQETGTGLGLHESVVPAQPVAYPTATEVGVVYPPPLREDNETRLG